MPVDSEAPFEDASLDARSKDHLIRALRRFRFRKVELCALFPAGLFAATVDFIVARWRACCVVPVRRSRTCSRHPDQRPLVTDCAGVCRMVRLARSIVVAALASFIGLAPLVFG